MFLLRGHYAAPIDYNDEALEQARRAAETLRNRLRDGGDTQDEALRLAVREALDDDFNTPRALALLFDAPPEAAGTVAEVLDVLGLGGLARRGAGAGRAGGEGARARAARAERDFAEPTRCATRSRRPAGRCATPPPARCCIAVTAELVYGTHPVREALRGRREVLRVLCSDRAARGARVAAGRGGGCVRGAASELAGSDDHQGLVAEVAPYPYVDADAAGAGSRAAGGAGRGHRPAQPGGGGAGRRVRGRGRPADHQAAVGGGHGGGLPGVGRRGRAPARSRRSRTWPTRCSAPGGRGCGATRRTRRATSRTTGTTIATARCSCWERRGEGCGRGCRDSCDAAVSIPMRGRIESLNVSTAAAVLLFEAVRQRRGG